MRVMGGQGRAAMMVSSGKASGHRKGTHHEHSLCGAPLQNVRTYGKGDAATRALNDVSFTVEAGEFVAIVGSSGSGKSTLLHLIGGVDRPSSGTVRVQGEDIFSRTDEQLAVFRRREVGLVYQFYNLIPVLDVVENMTLPVQMDGRRVNVDRLNYLLRTLGLNGREHHLPNQLSGGQQQRVAIGRALMNAPAIVLADEPTGNLDSKNSADIMGLLRRSNKELGQTLIVITHDEDIALTADRVIAIEDGRIARDERRRRQAGARSTELRRGSRFSGAVSTGAHGGTRFAAGTRNNAEEVR